MSDVLEILRRHGSAVDEYLKSYLARKADVPPRLLESINYSLTAGGKRLRPALVLESCRACGGDQRDASALAAAGAIELIHTFSLVHDDLPAMDDDDLRRGKPTNHKMFGEAMAILAGDAMVTLAFEMLAGSASSAIANELVVELARAAGPVGMIGGQVLDMDAENRMIELAELERIHRMKTGALIVCACRMGGIAAHAGEKVGAVTEYAKQLGIAFQIADDVLDVTATPEQLGKKTNKDADRGKNTYPRLMGLDASRAAAEKHVEAALAALHELGEAANGLRAIARFITSRQS